MPQQMPMHLPMGTGLAHQRAANAAAANGKEEDKVFSAFIKHPSGVTADELEKLFKVGGLLVVGDR